MKRLRLTTLFFITFLIGHAQTKNFIDQPYIEVSGSADTLVTPNEIFIKILLSEKDTRDKVPIEELEQRTFTALKGLGLDLEKNLTTADIASNFQYYLLKNKDVIKTKLYMLKVNDAAIASSVFIKLEELGISNISIDRVDHSDLENIRNLMRSNAIANAKARAEALTKPLNQTVGPAIHITDTENYNQQLQGRVAGIQIRGATTIQSDKFKELPKIDFEKID
ncbi:MAG TPA: SIMPL domain-containing protein [Parafilimonas sp.]|nr:SIMPL domain-containing protein [Parafilimonas sp.]